MKYTKKIVKTKRRKSKTVHRKFRKNQLFIKRMELKEKISKTAVIKKIIITIRI